MEDPEGSNKEFVAELGDQTWNSPSSQEVGPVPFKLAKLPGEP